MSAISMPISGMLHLEQLENLTTEYQFLKTAEDSLWAMINTDQDIISMVQMVMQWLM